MVRVGKHYNVFTAIHTKALRIEKHCPGPRSFRDVYRTDEIDNEIIIAKIRIS